MTAVAIGWLRSRHFFVVLAFCLLIAGVGAYAGDGIVRLPFLQRRLPVPFIVVLMATLVVTVPLCSRFGALERSLPRELPDRALAVALACGVALLSCLPAGLVTGGLFPWTPLLALLCLGVLAVLLLGPLAWAPTATLAMALIYIDFIYAQPIKTFLDSVGVPVLVGLLVLSASTFTVLGPRRD